MNSRDAAAYDEMMALLVEHSAAEAAAAVAAQSPTSPVNGSVNGLADVDEQAPSPAIAKKKRKRGSEDAFVTITLVLFVSLTQWSSVALQSNAPDLRLRRRTARLYPSSRMKRHQRRLPSPSPCRRRQYHLRRAARRAIDAGVVVVADPRRRRRMRRRSMERRVSCCWALSAASQIRSQE